MGTVQIDGSTPKITVGNATAEDATILFDGNAQDFYIALDDSADDLLIGLGSTVGSTPAISIDENLAVKTYGDITMTGTTPVLTIGDAGAEDTAIVFDGNAQDFHIGLDDSADSLTIGLGSTLGTTSHIVIDATGAETKPLQPAFCVKNALMSNLAITTTHTVTFSSEIFDQNADFDTTTYTFTAPVTGRYQLSCTLKIDDIDLDSDYHGGAIACSNRSIVVMSCKTPLIFNEDSNYHAWSSSALVDMDANDTAYVTFRQNAGDVMADINANESLFSGFLAC